MSNMSYCRFNNTLSDLLDCEAHMRDKLSKEGFDDQTYDTEYSKRVKLIETCIRIAMEYGMKDEDGVLTGDVKDMRQFEEEEEEESEEQDRDDRA